MINRNKKGFTIVELVIVIAVIAILAGVLIPTFASLIKKANQSADIQAVRQMNVALAAASAAEKPADLDALVKALADAGYNSEDSLIPVTKDHVFYWHMTYNTIVLANGNEVIAPTDNDELIANFEADLAKDGANKVLYNLRAGLAKVEVKDDASFIDAAMQGYKDITLAEDFVMSDGMSINTPANTTMTIDLGGKTLSTGYSDVNNNKHNYAINVYGTVTIENGSIDARGIQVMKGGKLILGEGATVDAIDSNGGACIWLYAGSELVIDGGTFNALNGDCDHVNDAAGKQEPGLINNNGGKITINGGDFTAVSNCYAITNNSGEVVINGGNFTASRGVICAISGKITVKGGTFTVAADAKGYPVYATGDATVVIEAGTLNTSNEGVAAICAPVNENYKSATITLKTGVIVNGTALAEDVVLDAAGEKYTSGN